MTQHIVIITGASAIPAAVVEEIPPDALLMAVDGGLDHARAAGLEPAHLVGDLDSVTDDGLAWAARNATIVRHPTDKDRTDTELALELAATFDPERITMIGGGDRLDHTIAGIGALGRLAVTSVPLLDGWWDGQHVRVLQGPASATLRLTAGSTLSLLALHGPCTNVNLSGPRWELERAELDPVDGLGISNEVPPGDDPVEVAVAVSSGVLTIFDDPAGDTPNDDDAEHSTPDPTDADPTDADHRDTDDTPGAPR